MSNKITVTIGGRKYNLIPEDSTADLEALAAQLNKEMAEAMSAARVTPLDAAVLTALNAKESLYQKEQSMEALRRQVQELLEENKRLRQELADTRREVTRAKNGKKTGK